MKTLTKQHGLTLVETIVSLAILSFGLVAVLKLNAYLVGQGTGSKQQAEALTLAQKKIEELRNFEQINTEVGVNAYNDIVTGTETLPKQNATYTLNWNVSNHTNPDHKVIDLTVSWPDKNGVNQTVSLSSIISKTDPATTGSVMSTFGLGDIQPVYTSPILSGN